MATVNTDDAAERAAGEAPSPAASEPERRRVVAGAQAAGDEVSLRELYLILRRRSPWIALMAVLVGLAAYVYLSSRPATFVAEATTIVAPPPIEADLGTGVRFRPEATVPFDTYVTLAFSRGVLEQVLPFHERSDINQLEQALELERIAGSATQPNRFLAVAHQVRSRDPEVAAASAEAWVAATVEHVRALLLENLDAVELITGDALTIARERLRSSESALERYRAEAEPDALRARLAALDEAWALLELDALASSAALAAREAEREALLVQRDLLGGDVGVVLAEAPEGVVALDGAIASLEGRLAALRAETERVRELQQGVRVQRAAIAAELSEATVRITELERGAREARQSVDTLAAIDPNVAYIAQVASSGVGVLSEASVPSAAEPRRAALVAVLAVVVTAFAGAVMALLAEAVRAPDDRGAPRHAEAKG